MAEQGTVFYNAYCPAPLCFPSRQAFNAGKRSHEVNIYSTCFINNPPQQPTYATKLAEQGVHSVLVGKVDLYDDPANMGFSEMYRMGLKDKPGLKNVIRRPAEKEDADSRKANQYGVGTEEQHHQGADEQLIDIAIDWLSNKSSQVGRPWVMKINMHNVHPPMYTTQEYWDMYKDGVERPKFGEDCESAQHPYAVNLRYHQGNIGFTDEQEAGWRRGYFAKISFMDYLLGKLMDSVAELGLSGNTNIIYTADHGFMIGKFGLWLKSTLYDDGIRIPCIAAGPDYENGKVVNTPVDAHDIRASLFHTTGTNNPEGWLGTPLQLIADDDKERVIFSEYHGQGSLSGSFAVRKGDWKLIYYIASPHQLFHLAEDPDELHNVYDRFPDKAAELEAELRNICSPEAVDAQAHAFQAEQQLHIDEYLKR
ncbi:MAG: hypothetical protein K0R75_3654, partial [Paenibacillaceae bacterium]|nr:hypothetical protein [Paenibacillaceae bacterium]